MTKINTKSNDVAGSARVTRRQFLQTSAAGAAAAAVGLGASRSFGAPAVGKPPRPNILFINTDQQGLDTLSAYGCPDVCTPNMDRLARRGTSFMQSYCADPVCCPSRTSWFTGRPPAENGVVLNSVPLVANMPDLGQLFGQAGYQAFYAGKWHVPERDVTQSFHALPAGLGQGELGDAGVSRAAQGFLRNYRESDPFFLTLGFLQPHDVCYWIMQHHREIGALPYPELAGHLPELPANFQFDPREPELIQKRRAAGRKAGGWSELHWRYYLWSYYRHVEMADAEIGRVLDALDDSPHAQNTLIVFTADHGEGRARHQMVTKGFLYDSAAMVPLVIAWPGNVAENHRDTSHLVSGLDFAPTVCDYARVAPPPKARGRSLRPLLESAATTWREFVISSSAITGRMVRTADFKYIGYSDGPTVQLFDMQNDSWETRNVAGESKYDATLADHRKLLADWEAPFDVAPVAESQKPARKAKQAG
jgi:arylsulfatase A-like enzyme